MAAWSAFAPWVKPLVPGCPDPMVERALCDAAIEFCEMTQAFTERVTLTTVVGTATYTVDSQAGVPGMVQAVTLDERVLAPVFLEALTNAYGEAWKDHTGTPRYYLGDNEDTLRLYPKPDVVETGTMTLAIRPSRTDTQWDDRLFERYGETIADGALARLFNQAATPWVDPSAALQRRQRFLQGINKVRAKAASAFTPATVYAQFV